MSWHGFVMTFVLLFIVIDAFGNLPFITTMGEGIRAVSLVFSLLLVAIPVSMVIRGLNLTGIIKT